MMDWFCLKYLCFKLGFKIFDYEVKDRVNDSISFSRFLGISLDDTVPDHSFLSRIRTEMPQKGAESEGRWIKKSGKTRFD